MHCKQTHNAVDSHNFAEDDARRSWSGKGRARRETAYLIKFLVRIRGARTPPPRMDEPVMKIPLRGRVSFTVSCQTRYTHQPAPRTLRPMQRPIPVDAHAYGLVSSKNRPTLNASPDPRMDCYFKPQLTASNMLTCEEEVETYRDSHECRKAIRVVGSQHAHRVGQRMRWWSLPAPGTTRETGHSAICERWWLTLVLYQPLCHSLFACNHVSSPQRFLRIFHKVCAIAVR